jgi:hypothetical protein
MATTRSEAGIPAGDPMQEERSAPPASTFIIRFWHEWAGDDGHSRWRGRIEHLQSAQRLDFVHIADVLAFLSRCGIAMDPESRCPRNAQGP